MPQDQPLHKAAHKGEREAVADLIEVQKVDVNALGAQNRTALHKAVGKGSYDVVDYLLQHGADVTMRDAGGLTPLYVFFSTHPALSLSLVLSTPHLFASVLNPALTLTLDCWFS